MKLFTRSIGIRLDDDMLNQLKVLSEHKQEPISEIIRLSITQYLKRK